MHRLRSLLLLVCSILLAPTVARAQDTRTPPLLLAVGLEPGAEGYVVELGVHRVVGPSSPIRGEIGVGFGSYAGTRSQNIAWTYMDDLDLRQMRHTLSLRGSAQVGLPLRGESTRLFVGLGGGLRRVRWADGSLEPGMSSSTERHDPSNTTTYNLTTQFFGGVAFPLLGAVHELRITGTTLRTPSSPLKVLTISVGRRF